MNAPIYDVKIKLAPAEVLMDIGIPQDEAQRLGGTIQMAREHQTIKCIKHVKSTHGDDWMVTVPNQAEIVE